ncbi:hypothetical protein RhiLY_12449 [Ceratobasidium sp. AG-Ba]|nr:hypothetical protein RhiLY_12449 [Ceratobasidium sp. AG-Ba]
MGLDTKPRRPKIRTVRSVVHGALPTLAHILHPNANPSLGDINPIPQQYDSDWVAITPIVLGTTRDFPMLPPMDLTRHSASLLGSFVSSFKAIPDQATWPMTSNSVGLSSLPFAGNDTFRVRVQDLADMWSALPGSGGTVRTLQWRKDTESVSHESVVLRVVGTLPDGSEDEWWICLERFPDGNFATLSRNRDRVTRPKSGVRAEIEFIGGLSFGHVLRVLNIIEEASPSYFIIGSNCWFYASVIVEMLSLPTDNRRALVKWVEGNNLASCDHHTTKELNHKQYYQISTRVRELSKSNLQRSKSSQWTSVM